MPGWKPFFDWREYDHLQDGAGITRAFTLAYKITDDGAEPWSARFIRFKQKDRVALAGAVGVMRTAVPELVARLGLNPQRTAFIPAPSSGDTAASANSHISTMTRLAADAAGAQFVLAGVTKQAHRPIHMCGGVDGRNAELAKANYQGARLTAETAVIFDDFITRGGTMSRMAQALIQANPGLTVYGVALGKTERRSYWGQLNNDAVPERWSRLWDEYEARYKEKQAR